MADEMVPVVLLLVIVLPLWLILRYITIWKKDKIISPENESTLSDLRREAERLERRLEVMERILDDEVPDWRQRSHDPL